MDFAAAKPNLSLFLRKLLDKRDLNLLKHMYTGMQLTGPASFGLMSVPSIMAAINAFLLHAVRRSDSIWSALRQGLRGFHTQWFGALSAVRRKGHLFSGTRRIGVILLLRAFTSTSFLTSMTSGLT